MDFGIARADHFRQESLRPSGRQQPMPATDILPGGNLEISHERPGSRGKADHRRQETLTQSGRQQPTPATDILQGGSLEISHERPSFRGEAFIDTSASSTTKSESQSPSMLRMAILKIDLFKIDRKTRERSLWGGAMSLLMWLLFFLYITLAVVEYQRTPPVTASELKWSSAYGLFPIEVECHGPSVCQLQVVGCGASGLASECIDLRPGAKQVLQVCYSRFQQDGLYVRWVGGDDAGVQVISQVEAQPSAGGVMPMGQAIVPGVHVGTFVRTQNLTWPDGHLARHRHEWFYTFLTPQLRATPNMVCGTLQTPLNTAQLVMAPQFYEQRTGKPGLLVELFGEAGGAFKLVHGACLAVYFGMLKIFSKRAHQSEEPNV